MTIRPWTALAVMALFAAVFPLALMISQAVLALDLELRHFECPTKAC